LRKFILLLFLFSMACQSATITSRQRGTLRLYDTDNSNYVELKAGATIASNVTWVLPLVDATVGGQVLSSDAAGTLSWVTAASNPTIATVTTTGQTVANEYTICDASADITLNLPSGHTAGTRYTIIKGTSGNTGHLCTVDPASTETILFNSTVSTYNLRPAGHTLTIVSDGTNWIAQTEETLHCVFEFGFVSNAVSNESLDCMEGNGTGIDVGRHTLDFYTQLWTDADSYNCRAVSEDADDVLRMTTITRDAFEANLQNAGSNADSVVRFHCYGK